MSVWIVLLTVSCTPVCGVNEHFAAQIPNDMGDAWMICLDAGTRWENKSRANIYVCYDTSADGIVKRMISSVRRFRGR